MSNSLPVVLDYAQSICKYAYGTANCACVKENRACCKMEENAIDLFYKLGLTKEQAQLLYDKKATIRIKPSVKAR